ncbi:MAG: hypothetical protein Q8P00_01355 [Dehalococcoidia bacterium]|nr:hypothetical protein [Dehalococcoidia bacterium]
MDKPTFKRGLLASILSFFLIIGLWLAFRPPAKGLYKIIKPYTFSIVNWELSNAPAKWFHEAKSRFQQPALSPDAQKELIGEYLDLASKLKRLEAEGMSAAGQTSEEVRRRLAQISPQVESVLQEQVSTVLIAEGFGQRLPSGTALLLPPLSFKMTPAPNLLSISPREKIELKQTFLMDAALDEEQIKTIESSIEKLGLSAYMERTGGIATYPSLIPPTENLDSMLSTIAHEWFHQYLFFRPLGRHYRSTYQMTTINETVANMAGKEIGARARSLYYGTPDAPGETGPPVPAFNFAAAMMEIRGQVDKYLSTGDVEQAEKFMEEQRLFLATRGYRLRKLNQAYLAFHASYADDPAFSNVIGQQLRQLRQRSTSLADFVKVISQVTTPDGLPRLLKR